MTAPRLRSRPSTSERRANGKRNRTGKGDPRAPKLANATELDGLLGIAATALFWPYLLGRLMLGAATLNAAIHEQRITTEATHDRWPPRRTGITIHLRRRGHTRPHAL